jgi:hypothetical protein
MKSYSHMHNFSSEYVIFLWIFVCCCMFLQKKQFLIFNFISLSYTEIINNYEFNYICTWTCMCKTRAERKNWIKRIVTNTTKTTKHEKIKRIIQIVSAFKAMTSRVQIQLTCIVFAFFFFVHTRSNTQHTHTHDLYCIRSHKIACKSILFRSAVVLVVVIRLV